MTASMLLKLGDYKFSIETATYQNLKQSWTFLWQSQQSIGTRPHYQFNGSGEQSITIDGHLFPHFKGNPTFFLDLAQTARDGKPLLLTAGTGDILNYWVVVSIDQKNSVFFKDGQARKIEFNLSLKYYGKRYGNVSNKRG